MATSRMSEVWCSSFGVGTTWLALFSTCGLQTEATILLLVAFIIVSILNITAYRQRLAAVAQQPAYVMKIGMTGREGFFFFTSVFLFVLHTAALATSLALHRDLYFHITHQAIAAAVWLAVAHFIWRSSKVHLVFDLRPLLLTMDLIYMCSIYIYIYLYFHQQVFSIITLKALVWASVVSLSLSIAMSVLDFKLPRQPSQQAGYEPLPDVEAGLKKTRTYISLFADACKWSWPEAWQLKLRVVVCVALLLSLRLLNIAVPYIIRNMTDTLAEAHITLLPKSFISVAYPWVFAYLAVTFFQGGAGGGVVGFINNIRSYLWIPVAQDAYRRISLLVFTHVLNLDLNFHLKRKTGEVTKQVDRGTSSIQNILSTVVFSIGPQLLDVFIAATYVAVALNPAIALIMFITIGSYVPLTVLVTEWRGGFRREMNRTDNAKSSRLTDALLNWETVKYFCNEVYEEGKYAASIDEYQTAEYNFLASLNVINIVQSTVMFTGMAMGVLTSAKGVAAGNMTVGDVTMFLTLMQQLYGPLNFFGTYYRMIQQYMIDMENLFELLDMNTAIPDASGAQPLQLTAGEVEFRDVVFSYEPGREVLNGVDFRIDGGKTIAFVGATGSGKSTITRLLLRFYDTSKGDIMVDGQALKKLQQSSLRAVIGMVPQDCVLFNDTIRHNIRYGNMEASDQEVEAAAEAACIHETVTQNFPLGYNTVVGERGLRLSGGEKQRVAFARALLKNPPILVLDEATSALDSITEKKIQAALRVSRSRRTTLIVAHRLSTIMDADAIAVMQEGRIAEFGKHQELLSRGGLYSELWSKQLSQKEDDPEDVAAAHDVE